MFRGHVVIIEVATDVDSDMADAEVLARLGETLGVDGLRGARDGVDPRRLQVFIEAGSRREGLGLAASAIDGLVGAGGAGDARLVGVFARVGRPDHARG